MTRAFSIKRNRAALRRLVARARSNERGVAAVEFAFVLPVMLTVYFGVVEIGQGVMIDRKITQLTRALGDLAAQGTTLPTTEVGNIFDAATTVIMPYTSVAPRMSVTSIVIDKAGLARVCWSEQRNSTAPARGSTIVVPDSMKIAGTSLIMAQASYEFTPTIGYLITGSIVIGNDPIYLRPRTGLVGGSESIEQVERVGRGMCPTFS